MSKHEHDRQKIDIANRFLEQGNTARQKGYLDRAARLYRQSIDYQPTAQAHTFLGQIYAIKGFPQKAIRECKQAITIDPAYGDPYNDIGRYLIQLKNYDAAVDWLEKALQAPNYEHHVYPHLNLAKIYEYKGQWEQALFHYDCAVRQAPHYERARTAREQLIGRYN